MRSVQSWLSSLAIAALAALTLGAQAHAQAPSPGASIFQTRCKSCHEPAIDRAPNRDALAQRPAADIERALTSGIMAPMAQGMSPDDIHAVAVFLTAARAGGGGSGGGTEMPQVAVKGQSSPDPMCATNPPMSATPGDWASTGLDDRSSRFQKKPGLTAAELPRLKVKWSFAMPGGGQPTVVGDWLFVTNRSGKFYALDAKTGCVHWAVNDLVARTTPMVVKSPISPSGWLTVVGQSDRIVRAFDAQTGKEIWRSARLATHAASVLTGAPVIAGDRLLVPISSIEEAFAMGKAYACCTFRGSLAALDLKTGQLIWKTTMIDEPSKVIREKEGGLKVSGPAGAAIWAAPSLDLKRGLVYVVTGDSYTDVTTIGDDAIVALEIATGKIRWRRQVTQNDNFVMGCGPRSASGNCPTPMGPDYDFGATPVLMTLKGGKQVLVAGQKSGIVYGLNPDSGALVWKTQVGVGSALGGVEWGIGADDSLVYVPISDLVPLFMRGAQGAPAAKSGLYALDPATGAVVWGTPSPVAPCHYGADKAKPSNCMRAQSAAPAIIPGLVFEGALDGWFRAYDAKTGKIVWAYSTTAQTYDTVNGIKDQPGGGIDGMGPTIAHGMIFLASGNNGAAGVGSNGVNVLLAFSVDGK
jgi:polyvinyl alcohol dehydrogenase (cytochrome)